jgi:tetratricopeptide (TPR) repeat protein
VGAFREAVRLDPEFVPPHGNLVGSLIALNRFDDARAALPQAGSRGTGFITLRRMAYLLAFLQHDSAAMARELSLTRETPDAALASTWEARTALAGGRFATAHTLFQRAADLVRVDNRPELSAQWTMEDAEAHALAGECGAAREEIAAGLELSRDNFTLERASRALALCGVPGATTLSRELADRFPQAALTIRLQLPVTAAALALKRGDSARARELLEDVSPYDHAPASEGWPGYLRGLAQLQLKNAAAARLEFQGILDHRGEAPTSPLYALAQLGFARAAVAAGNIAEARQAYDAFFTIWGEADANLPQILEARREYGRVE